MAMPLAHHRFTADEYHRMAEAGILTEDDRVELLDGEIIQVTPIGPRHARCVDELIRRLVQSVGDAVIVRVQGPIGLAIDSEPEPDLALLREQPDGYGDAHPTPRDVLLVIEVYRDPAHDGTFRSVESIAQGGTLSPLMLPHVTLSTADILA